jgi:hypothetical protein
MDVAAVLSLVSTLAVVCGVIFAGYQVRVLQRQRRRESELAVAAAVQNAPFQAALQAVTLLPAGLDREGVEGKLGADSPHIFYWFGAMETLGILVHHGEVSFQLVDDFISGPVVLSWRNLQGYVSDVRQATGRDTMHEWFQWLAERFIERESAQTPVPAHIAYRDWTP